MAVDDDNGAADNDDDVDDGDVGDGDVDIDDGDDGDVDDGDVDIDDGDNGDVDDDADVVDDGDKNGKNTSCSRQDQSTVQVTYWAGMVFDQLLGKRRNENRVKREGKGVKREEDLKKQIA